MKIGVTQFSYHRYFGEVTPWETKPDIRWTVTDFVRRVSSLQVGALSLQTCYLAPDDLPIVKNECAALNLEWIIEWGHPDGVKMGASPEAVADLKRWLRLASAFDRTLVRVVAGYSTYRGREPVPTQIGRLVPVLREVCEEAAALGIVLALENHADFTPIELVELIERVAAPNLRATFDTGNCVRLDANLIESTRYIAPITEIVHLRDLWVRANSRGNPSASWPSAPLGQGMLDIPGVLSVLHQQGFNGYLLIEMAHMHSKWPEEDAAVAASVRWLKAAVEESQRRPGPP